MTTSRHKGASYKKSGTLYFLLLPSQPFLSPRGRRRVAPRTSRLRRLPASAQRANLIHSVLGHSRVPCSTRCSALFHRGRSEARREKKFAILAQQYSLAVLHFASFFLRGRSRRCTHGSGEGYLIVVVEDVADVGVRAELGERRVDLLDLSSILVAASRM